MKKLVVLAVVTFVLTIFSGCQKQEEFYDETPELANKQDLSYYEGQMILGKRLDNPYSIENMQKAYQNLQAENKLKSAVSIETTHFYVRFRPKSFQELDRLTRDTTLYFYDYPLDVEIKRGGTHYHDPSIPANEITWQYTVVPVDYTFPDIQYQKLADLFLQEETGELQQLKSGSMDYFEWLVLETEALRITGNLSDDEVNGVGLKSTSWRPSGNIKVYDDIINSYSTTQKVFDHYEYYNCETGEAIYNQNGEDPYLKQLQLPDDDEPMCQRAVYRFETSTTNSHNIPLEGVTVLARSWFTTHEGMTDANGNFTCDGTFSSDANYSIKWERYDFDIRDGSYGQAYFNGPKQTGEWNLVIRNVSSPKSYLFAHIFRAAYTYYYKHSQWGIKAPPRRDGMFGFLNQRLHIAGKDASGRSKYVDIRHLWQSAEISVFSKTTSGVPRDSREIFGTTIHELAHASHWEIGYTSPQYAIDWIFDSPYLPESWAVGVETILTRDVYHMQDYNNFYQRYTISQMSDGYTCIVEDLIDTNNQRKIWGSYCPNDQVSGYTLSQIESALPNDLGSWWVWRTNLKDFSNPTEQYLDALFQSFK